MTFSVKIDGATPSGQALFPFSFGQLLDERLDEAYLHITQSTVPVYKPTTPVQVTINNGTSTTFDYVVASDNAYELPVGSGLYRHDIHLIETTKMLEGIYCQSITFTNVLSGRDYEKYASNALPAPVGGEYAAKYVPIFGYVYKPFSVPNVTFAELMTPSYSVSIPSIATVAAAIKASDSGLNTLDLATTDASGSLDTEIYYTDGAESNIITSTNGTASLTVTAPLIVQYTIFFAAEIVDPEGVYSNHVYKGYRFSYTIVPAANQRPLKPLSVTDCINRVLDLAEPILGSTNQSHATAKDLDYVSRRFNLNAEQAAEFDKIPAPDFTMTQCTLREQLKVIGGYIHGEPRLKPNGEIYYDMYGDPVESEEITNATPYVYRGVSHDISQYCTQIDTTASNIVNALNYAQGVVFAPNATNAKTIRTESINVRATEDNGYIETDFPIQDVVKVEASIYNEDGGLSFDFRDITPYIFTETDYNATLSAYGGGYPLAKSYALYYSIGQKGIRGLFFKETSALGSIYPYLEYYSIVNILAAVMNYQPSTIRDAIDGDYTRVVFRVSYIPIYNTRFSHGKQYVEDGEDYTQIYNQSENLIETRYFGENAKGVAARLGNVEQTRTYIFDGIGSIPKVGQLLNVGTSASPDYYAISAVNTEALPTHYKTTVALTKDFNRISEYVGISSNKRVYEVSEREAYLRNVLLKEYAIVGKRKGYKAGIFRHKDGIASAFLAPDAQTPNALCVTTALCWGGTYNRPYATRQEPALPLVSLPVVSSAFGNAIVFSWGYKDNYSAGARLIERASGDVSGWWQQDVRYTDQYGRMLYYNFFLLTQNNTINLGQGFARGAPYVQTQLINASGTFDRDNSDIKTTDKAPYFIRKDSREILNFNFELEFKANVKNLIIGSGLASASKLVGATTGAAVIHYPMKSIGRFDRIYPATGGSSLPTVTTGQTSGGEHYVAITLPTTAHNQKRWVIHAPYVEGTPYQVEDEMGKEETYTPHTGGEILLACNDPAALYQELGGNTIYISLSKSQKEDTQ